LNRSLSLSKITTFFLRSAFCNNVFSLGQTDGHRYHDSPLPKTSSLVENCTKFGQLILSKIIKIVATSCQILRLKCTKFDFGWGSAPDPAVGAHSAPLGPLAEFKGATFATSQHLDMSRCWALALRCGKFLSVGGEFVVQQVVELL